jgi:hypothetical protein
MATAAQIEQKNMAGAPYIAGGASFLSMQSTDETDTDHPQTELISENAWKKLRGYNEQRIPALRTWRNSWWMENWSDLAQFEVPRRSIWLTQSAGGWPTANNMLRGQEINQAIIDPTGTYAIRICAGGMVTGLASPSRPWFDIVTSDKRHELDHDSRVWIDEHKDRVYQVLANSNFYNSFAQECEDEIVFGTSPSICYDDLTDIVRFYNPAVGEYYVACNGTLRVDTLGRVFVMTIGQMASFFGADNLPPEIRSLWNQGGSQIDSERIVGHLIEPNFEIQGDKETKIPGAFTYRETYWVYGIGSKQPLALTGFRECPFTVGRWATQSNDAYGRSVGMDVLPDIIQLQVETRRKAEALEKNVRPPLIADMSMKNQPSSQVAGAVTYVPQLNGGVGMKSLYQQQFNLADITADIQQLQGRIKMGFFNDLFMALSQNAQMPDAKITAYQSAAIVQERMAVLGPVIESKLENLRMKLKRVWAIMERRGLIDAKPAGLRGIPLGIEFVSALALAQKAAALGGIERMVALLGNLAAEFPDSKDNLDTDSLINLTNQLLGNPSRILRGPEMVAQMRQQRAQQQQQMQNAQMAEHAANVASTGADAANTMANTSVGQGQGTVLSKLLGTSQQ